MGSKLWSISHYNPQEPGTLPIGRPRCRTGKRSFTPYDCLHRRRRKGGAISSKTPHWARIGGAREGACEGEYDISGARSNSEGSYIVGAQSTDEGGCDSSVLGSRERSKEEAKIVGLSDEFGGGGARPSDERGGDSGARGRRRRWLRLGSEER
jgi:hypothetical protein